MGKQIKQSGITGATPLVSFGIAGVAGAVYLASARVGSPSLLVGSLQARHPSAVCCLW